MESIKQQKNRAYLACEQYTKQVLKNQYPFLDNSDFKKHQSIINFKQTILQWHRKLQSLKRLKN